MPSSWVVLTAVTENMVMRINVRVSGNGEGWAYLIVLLFVNTYLIMVTIDVFIYFHRAG